MKFEENLFVEKSNFIRYSLKDIGKSSSGTLHVSRKILITVATGLKGHLLNVSIEVSIIQGSPGKFLLGQKL